MSPTSCFNFTLHVGTKSGWLNLSAPVAHAMLRPVLEWCHLRASSIGDLSIWPGYHARSLRFTFFVHQKKDISWKLLPRLFPKELVPNKIHIARIPYITKMIKRVHRQQLSFQRVDHLFPGSPLGSSVRSHGPWWWQAIHQSFNVFSQSIIGTSSRVIYRRSLYLTWISRTQSSVYLFVHQKKDISWKLLPRLFPKELVPNKIHIARIPYITKMIKPVHSWFLQTYKNSRAIL